MLYRSYRLRFPSFLLIFMIAVVGLCPVSARADRMKEFSTSCIYGTLAGTLVGAATLAFTSKPGDNLNNVARGASFGLYAGMLLGAYVIWMVPDHEEEPDGVQGPDGENPSSEDEPPPESRSLTPKTQLFSAVVPIVPTSEKLEWGVYANVLKIQF